MKKQENLISFIFMFVGAFFLVISVFMLPSVFNYENKIDTIGTITEINRRTSGDDDTYDVYVSYKIDGKEYEGKLNGYSSSYHVGKQIDIYYDKNNPNNIGTKGLDLVFLVFPILGGIAFVVGLLFFIKTRGKKKLLAKLRESGMMINANYVETRLNSNYTVNGRSPYNIICEWFCAEENQNYRFVSENLWNDPSTDITNRNITTFPVFINPQNKKQYVIDIQTILPNAK